VYSVSSVVRDKKKINHREHFCRYNIGYYTPRSAEKTLAKIAKDAKGVNG